MCIYIALLRGINVGGHHPVKMGELRNLCTSLGYSRVATYIQSGNIIFRAEGSTIELRDQLSEAIMIRFGFEVPVMILDAGELRQIITENPFITDGKHELSYLHLTLLTEKPLQDTISLRPFPINPGEKMIISGRSVYLYLPDGYGRTRLNNTIFETRLQQQATTRNWKTMLEILKITEKE